jgi:hypothetical protein
MIEEETPYFRRMPLLSTAVTYSCVVLINPEATMRSRRRTVVAFALLTVMCSLASLAARTAPDRATPRRFAILVGINQYSDPGLVSLQKAQNDAEDMGKALGRLGGYKSVTVMSGSLPYTDVNFPSKNKIIERVRALAEIVRPEDQVLFFFSGHGVNDTTGGSFLLPIDAQVKDPTDTGIDFQDDIIVLLPRASDRANSGISVKDRGSEVRNHVILFSLYRLTYQDTGLIIAKMATSH